MSSCIRSFIVSISTGNVTVVNRLAAIYTNGSAYNGGRGYTRKMTTVVPEPPQCDIDVTDAWSCLSCVARLWDRYQVELHGRFSSQKIERMRGYAIHTSRTRLLLLIVLTPAPTLIAVALIESIPLSPPNDGSSQNYAFWVRLAIATTMIIASLVNHIRYCVPSLPMTSWQLLCVAFVAMMCGIGFAYGISLVIGFPIPFTPLAVSIPALPAVVLMLITLWRPSVRGNSPLQQDVLQQLWVIFGQVAMMWVYPLYLFAFTAVASKQQSAFTLVLPVIKLTFKNYFSRMLRHVDDCKPAFIVFNADLFSALYVVSILQTSQSLLDTLLVLVIDIVQMAMSMYDVHAVMLEIRSLVLFDQFDGTLLDLFVEMARSTDVRKQLDRRSSSMKTHISRIHGAIGRRVVPLTGPGVPHLGPLPVSHRTRLAAKISKVLYITEFVLLIEFVEVMIPVIYGLYLGIISNLPNRAYYPRLASLDTEEQSHSISIITLNATLEFISFLVTCRLLDRQLQLSSLRLLGFALESQRSLIQSSLTAWTSCVIQQAVEHTGMDFTLQFAWLHRPSP